MDASSRELLVIIIKYYVHVPRELRTLLCQIYLNVFNWSSEELINKFKKQIIEIPSQRHTFSIIATMELITKYFPVDGFRSRLPLTNEQVNNYQILTYLKLKLMPFKGLLAQKGFQVDHVEIYFSNYRDILITADFYNVSMLDISAYPECLDGFKLITDDDDYNAITYTTQLRYGSELHVLIYDNNFYKSNPAYIIPL